jgi:DNA repair exonuclease SbcCD ATPase subunit
MKQYINLVQKNTIIKPVLSGWRIIQVWGLLAILLTFVAIAQKNALSESQNKILALKVQQKQINEQLVQLGTLWKTRNKNSVSEDTSLLERKIQRLENLLTILQQKENTKSYPFSAYLEGLATHSMEGISLSLIHIQTDNGDLSIAGIAQNPRKVAQVVQSWHNIVPLQGKEFTQLKMVPSTAKEGWLQFDLRTE